MEPTFATAIQIHHVRHLQDIEIPLSQETRKHLILTGKNGSGKTSILNALSSFLAYAATAYNTQEFYEKRVSYWKDRLSQEVTTESARHEQLQNRRGLEDWQRRLAHWTDGATANFTSLAAFQEKYQNGELILAYFGDNRKIAVETSSVIEKVELQPVYDMKAQPSQELVKYLVGLKATQAFAQTEDNPQQASEIRAWFQRFEGILRKIYDDPALTLQFDTKNFSFSIQATGREPFDFNTMSMGYAAVFDIIGDLIMRMESKGRYDLEGIVLIDEIETHLHVELQKKILPILSELFPQLQFILTTHSPFVLNSAQNSVVYDLENRVLVENGLTNLPYEGIVEGYFQVNTLSQELQEKFDAYCRLVQKPAPTDQECAQLAELEQYLDAIPDYLALDFSEEYQRLKLEHHR